ncbi:hypothetical protein CVT24_011833 [Panaeolus cyanescens]|uniref:Yeast cell wall synthesis Kre9/Knh1-like N-terminal domain-containing protein n=1 Tax=Panaeolus cyanescens TaxID=181874 RepID=A0A409YNS3_9AGAR|nr:hypothetical protein CVT24_011833 [Panaeolus cyanescens]
MRAFAVVSALIASTLAYTITSPSDTQDWNNDGAQSLSWQRVDTDPATFAVVLFNRSTQSSTLIASNVDGKTGSLKIEPPSGGWPHGDDFRIRLVRDPQSLTAILAESQDFDIDDVPLASRTATTSSSPTPTSPTQGGNASQTPGAASSLTVQTGLVALMSMLGFALV